MSFTFMIIEDKEGKWFCPVDEKTGKIFVNHRYDAKSFINQYNEGVILEISSPGQILKNDLAEAKRLLEAVINKLRSPGRYEKIADEIERFLNK